MSEVLVVVSPTTHIYIYGHFRSLEKTDESFTDSLGKGGLHVRTTSKLKKLPFPLSPSLYSYIPFLFF